MTRLEDLRRRFPVADRATYARAYADAERAARLGEAVHDLREGTGWTRADLAARLGVPEDAVAQAEEGDPGAAGGFAAVFAALARHGREGGGREGGGRDGSPG